MPYPTEEECRRCVLRRHLESNQLPEGAEVAWFVFKQLRIDTAQRYGLLEVALESLGLELTPSGVRDLLAKLEAIDLGRADAREQLRKKD